MSRTVPLNYSLEGKRVWVAGHRGMVGRAIIRRLEAEQCDVVTIGRDRVDLRDQRAVDRWLMDARPHAIFMAAAKVGGILANDTWPADFIYDNTVIAANVIHAAHRAGTEKLLFLGSSCIYPKLAPQPMPEDSLLTGPLEPTNQWYAVAKIMGIMLCRAYRRQHGCDFISAMPTNLYGPYDNFNVAEGHVVPGLIVKAHAAKAAGRARLEVWGSGRPRRELMHVDDLADALVFLMRNYSDEEHVNVGTGQDISIRELADEIARAVGFEPELIFDLSKPDGTPRKLLDIGRLTAMGWTPGVTLADGLRSTYAWYLEHVAGRPGG